MNSPDIIKAIEAHASDFDLKPSTIGQVAVGNRHAYDRLKRGSLHVGVAERIIDWMADDRARRELARGAA